MSANHQCVTITPTQTWFKLHPGQPLRGGTLSEVFYGQPLAKNIQVARKMTGEMLQAWSIHVSAWQRVKTCMESNGDLNMAALQKFVAIETMWSETVTKYRDALRIKARALKMVGP